MGLASAVRGKKRGGDNVREFSVGSRQMPWGAVLASIIAAELSAGTFLGTPGEGYHGRNFLYAQLAIGTVIARIIVAYLFIRPFYDYNVVVDLPVPADPLRRGHAQRGQRGLPGHAAAGQAARGSTSRR
ncbi:MAG: hypothetical protein WDO13_19805 [Verrucomicrobiota bacterium]